MLSTKPLLAIAAICCLSVFASAPRVQAGDQPNPLVVAQAAPSGEPQSEEQKRRREQDKQKAVPNHNAAPQQNAPSQQNAQPQQHGAPLEKHALPATPTPVKPALQATPSTPHPASPETIPEKRAFEHAAPAHDHAAPSGNPQPANTNSARSAIPTAPSPATPSPTATVHGALPASPAPRLQQIQQARKEHVEDGGRRTVIQEPGNRVIVKQDNRLTISHDETGRFSALRNSQTQQRPGGITETSYQRADGFHIVSEVDASGRLVRRYRRGPDGREYRLIDNRAFLAGLAAGAAVGFAVAVDLRPPVITIPRNHYIVDYREASDDDIYDALSAPPVERLQRVYSLDEIRYSNELRDRMRRVDLDDINFEFGASDVTPDQFPKLERLARAINRVIGHDPDEVFLIEGYTDAVGSDIDNLSLSDRRADTIARILTETFAIPPENMVTQGYGKEFLKIDTPEPERANRRVAVRRITPLMSERR